MNNKDLCNDYFMMFGTVVMRIILHKIFIVMRLSQNKKTEMNLFAIYKIQHKNLLFLLLIIVINKG